MYIMILIFADNVFKNDFTCSEAIYKLIVSLKSDCIHLQWKDFWAETFIFCNIENIANEICIS